LRVGGLNAVLGLLNFDHGDIPAPEHLALKSKRGLLIRSKRDLPPTKGGLSRSKRGLLILAYLHRNTSPCQLGHLLEV
jgi:hypothetical protein